jgi:hypothetical protein
MLGSQTPFRPYWVVIVTLLRLNVDLNLHRDSSVNIAAREMFGPCFLSFKGISSSEPSRIVVN